MKRMLKWIAMCFPTFFAALPIHSQAEEFRYRYIDLGSVLVPGYDSVWPIALNDRGEVAETISKCDENSCFDYRVAIYKDGKITVFQPGDALAINNRLHTLAGYMPVENGPFGGQAAIFQGYNKLTLIPHDPGETFSAVMAINDFNDALITTSTGSHYGLFSHGRKKNLDFGPNVKNIRLGALNLTNNNLIGGTSDTGLVNDRAFRFNTKTGETRLLDPVAGDTQSWGLDANNMGYVLGYSFVTGSPYHERIGVWDRFGRFHTYYDETINTSYLAFNDRNQIIQPIYNEGLLYLIPRPGVRLNVADLVENLPAGARLEDGSQINNRGDIFGYFPSFFLLKRICSPEDERDADAAVAAAAVPAHPISATARASLMARPEMRLAAARMAAMRNGKHL